MKKALVLIILAVLLVAGAVGAYTAYAQPPGPPGPPPLLSAGKPIVYGLVYDKDDGVWIDWKPNGNHATHDIYVYTSGSWELVVRYNEVCRSYCYYLHQGPSPGQIYWYTIRGMTSDGVAGPWSDYVKISVPWECEAQSPPEQGPDGNPPGPTSTATPTRTPTSTPMPMPPPPILTPTPTPTPSDSNPPGPPGS